MARGKTGPPAKRGKGRKAPQCNAKTQRGKRCTNTAWRPDDPPPGHDPRKCNAHQSHEVREATGFGGPQEGSGPKRKPKPPEVLRQLIESNPTAFFVPFLRTLGLEIELVELEDGTVAYRAIDGGQGARIFGQSKDGDTIMSPYTDLEAQMRATERIMDRVFGKPKQSTEIVGSGSEDDSEGIQIPTDDDRKREVALILMEAGAVKPSKNGKKS